MNLCTVGYTRLEDRFNKLAQKNLYLSVEILYVSNGGPRGGTASKRAVSQPDPKLAKGSGSNPSKKSPLFLVKILYVSNGGPRGIRTPEGRTSGFTVHPI